jgi:cytochrome c
MTKKILTYLVFGSSLCLLWSFLVQDNTAPEVKLMLTRGNGAVGPNTLVPYRIEVLDKEDGASDYGEIPMNEVILTVKYVSDSSKTKAYLASDANKNDRVLSWMGSNGCFTCHRAKDRLIGPSFSEIAERYSEQANRVSKLSEKVIKGSQGVWGDQIMPAQTHLPADQVQGVIQWILRNARAEDYNFLPGLQGAFRTWEVKPGTGVGGAYVLSAHYLDHGMNDNPPQSKLGKDVLVLFQK